MTTARKEALQKEAVNIVDQLMTSNAIELRHEASTAINNAKQFWSLWNEEDRASKLSAFARRAREIQAKQKEATAGRLNAQFELEGIVVAYVTAIRELGNKPFSL